MNWFLMWLLISMSVALNTHWVSKLFSSLLLSLRLVSLSQKNQNYYNKQRRYSILLHRSFQNSNFICFFFYNFFLLFLSLIFKYEKNRKMKFSSWAINWIKKLIKREGNCTHNYKQQVKEILIKLWEHKIEFAFGHDKDYKSSVLVM